MDKRIKMISIGIMLGGMLLATSCGTAVSKEPTPDVAAIKTEAAMEVFAQLTVEAVVNPSATPLPATMTPLPTATIGTAASPTPITYSSGGGSSSSGGSSGTPIPTSTPDVYKCDILAQSPLDGPQMTGWIFDAVWTVKNTGIVTWDRDDYYVVWVDDAAAVGLLGESADLTPKHKYKLSKDVDPYDTIDIIVDVEIPPQPEDDIQVMYMAIVNDNGDMFCNFNLVVTYTYPAPTKTPD